MDPKAAAKSKRSQSQQGKRNHPTPSAAMAQKKKEAPTQSKQPQHGGVARSRRHLHNLPSNWDRYDMDEDDDAVEAEKGVSDVVRRDAREPAAKVKKPLAGGGDALAPKSKGADFKYLVEQARFQARDEGYGEGGLASTSLFDETVPDLFPGLLSIISAKGESLLSWCSNDNFTVDDDAGSSFEVPFLSMNVHALAAQLSKLSMAQRLFIEEDILPAELMKHADRLNESNVQRFDHVEAQNSSGSKHYLAEDAVPGAENVPVGDDHRKSIRSRAVEGRDSMQRSGKGLSPRLSQGQDIKQDLTNSLVSPEWHSKEQSGESGSNAGLNTIQDPPSTFEAAVAEAELDRLLDSFGGINDFASSSLGSSSSATNNAVDCLEHMGAVSSRQEGSSSSKAGAGVSLEGTVDEILAKSRPSHSPGIREDSCNSSSTQPKPRDLSTDVYAGSSTPGFSDSRRIVPLEKSIDDLLAETNFFCCSSINGQREGGLAQDSPRGSSVRVDAPYPREDHDSRDAASTVSLHETSDDLLAQTSACLENPAEPSRHPKRKSQVPHVKPTVSKALDDIDAFLDSL